MFPFQSKPPNLKLLVIGLVLEDVEVASSPEVYADSTKVLRLPFYAF